MPAHVKANPVEVSLLRSEAIVFVTKHLAHLLQQTLGLGKIGDGVNCIKTMYKKQCWCKKTRRQAGCRAFALISAARLASLFRRIFWNPRISAHLHHVRAHRVNRIVVVASISLVIFVLAVFAGWSHYQAQPEGDLLSTPIGQCDPRSHSFSTGFVFALVAAGLVFVAIAGIGMLASFIPRWSEQRARLKRLAGTSISVVLVLLASSFTSSLFEARLPLHVKPGCLQNAP